MYKIAEVTIGFNLDMLYPQYKDEFSQQDIISVDTWVQLQRYAQKILNDGLPPNAKVREHMIRILDGIVPFGVRIVGEGIE